MASPRRLSLVIAGAEKAQMYFFFSSRLDICCVTDLLAYKARLRLRCCVPAF